MTRDQCILVRPDGSVLFDSPAAQARQAAESRDAWLTRTVGKAEHEQKLRGEVLTRHERIAIEERPDPKVRNAVRVDRLTGKLTVPMEVARALLRERYVAEAAGKMRDMKALAEAASWFAPVADPAVTVWERQLAALQSEARRVAGELVAAKSVPDLLAIEAKWPNTEAKEAARGLSQVR